MTQKLSVELPTKNYQKIRVEIVDKYRHVCPHFYNLRILNQFLKLLKANDIKYIYYKKDNTVIVDQFHLVIKTSKGSGRFFFKNKACFRNLEFRVEASSMSELLVKMLRFRVIGIGAVQQIAGIEKRQVKKYLESTQ